MVVRRRPHSVPACGIWVVEPAGRHWFASISSLRHGRSTRRRSLSRTALLSSCASEPDPVCLVISSGPTYEGSNTCEDNDECAQQLNATCVLANAQMLDAQHMSRDRPQSGTLGQTPSVPAMLNIAHPDTPVPHAFIPTPESTQAPVPLVSGNDPRRPPHTTHADPYTTTRMHPSLVSLSLPGSGTGAATTASSRRSSASTTRHSAGWSSAASWLLAQKGHGGATHHRGLHDLAYRHPVRLALVGMLGGLTRLCPDATETHHHGLRRAPWLLRGRRAASPAPRRPGLARRRRCGST